MNDDAQTALANLKLEWEQAGNALRSPQLGGLLYHVVLGRQGPDIERMKRVILDAVPWNDTSDDLAELFQFICNLRRFAEDRHFTPERRQRAFPILKALEELLRRYLDRAAPLTPELEARMAALDGGEFLERVYPPWCGLR